MNLKNKFHGKPVQTEPATYFFKKNSKDFTENPTYNKLRNKTQQAIQIEIATKSETPRVVPKSPGITIHRTATYDVKKINTHLMQSKGLNIRKRGSICNILTNEDLKGGEDLVEYTHMVQQSSRKLLETDQFKEYSAENIRFSRRNISTKKSPMANQDSKISNFQDRFVFYRKNILEFQ